MCVRVSLPRNEVVLRCIAQDPQFYSTLLAWMSQFTAPLDLSTWPKNSPKVCEWLRPHAISQMKFLNAR